MDATKLLQRIRRGENLYAGFKVRRGKPCESTKVLVCFANPHVWRWRKPWPPQ